MHVYRSFVGLFALTLIAGGAQAQEKETKELKEVAVKNIKLWIPGDWKQETPASSMRAAQFKFSGDQADDAVELVVFYFNGNEAGGIKANIDRWISKFHETDRKVKLVRGNSKQGSYVMSNISGTWRKTVGPPIAQKSKDQPGSRVVNMILVADNNGKDDYYFIKLSGKDKAVAGQLDVLRKAIGAKKDDEKPYGED